MKVSISKGRDASIFGNLVKGELFVNKHAQENLYMKIECVGKEVNVVQIHCPNSTCGPSGAAYKFADNEAVILVQQTEPLYLKMMK